MIRNKKPVHPAYNRFMKENEYAIDVLTELTKEALNIYSTLYVEARRRDGKIDTNDLDMDIYNRLDPKTIDAINEASDSYGNKTVMIRGSHNARDYEYNVDIFGYLKVGERSSSTLEDDIDISHIIHDDRTGRDFFDMSNAIMVGTFIWKDGVYDTFMEDYHAHFEFSFSTVLVRLITSNRYISEEEALRNSIVNTILNKMIMFELSRPYMIKIMKGYDLIPGGEFISDNPKSSVKTADLIKMMIIYKIFYNVVNGLDDRSVEDTIKYNIGLVDMNIYSMAQDKGLSSAISTLRSKLTNKLFDIERPIDRYLEELFDVARASMSEMSLIVKNNGQIVQNDYVDNRGLIGRACPHHMESSNELTRKVMSGMSIGVEDTNYLNRYENSLAVESILGFEDINHETQTYQDFIRTSRAKLLGTLNAKHRKTFIEYENEILKLKSEAMNCETSENQQAVIKRSESIGKRISLDLEVVEENSTICDLLIMLDTYRADITQALSSKSYINLRKNSLYGVSRIKSTFNL